MDRLIGIENVVKQLGRCNHNGLAVFTARGNEEIFRRYQLEGENMEDVNNALLDFLDDLEEQNPTSFVNYKIQLYEYPEGAKKRKGCGVITFQFNETPNKEHFKKKENNMLAGDYVHKDTMLLAIENANLKNKNEALEARLEAIEAKMIGFDDEEDQEETQDEQSFIGSFNDAIKDKMPQLIDMVIGMLAKPQQTAISGVNNIDEIITEFKQINPQIENDLAKLLQLAKTKPELFKMLIQQLRAM